MWIRKGLHSGIRGARTFLEDLKYCTEYTREDYENINGYSPLRVAVSRMFSGLS
ncbi:MAG: hypothetical protein J5707_03335 [Candidatus Methanomethylophilus sp.]|nr:hypothetical protein [Methanomethylophilus sp.]